MGQVITPLIPLVLGQKSQEVWRYATARLRNNPAMTASFCQPSRALTAQDIDVCPACELTTLALAFAGLKL